LTELKNDLLLRALRRQPVPRTPVWLMRQAGRYLPEYRATRQRAGSFLGLCTNPEYACEVTLQPLARFALDAAIIFSDILVIPYAQDVGLRFEEGEGPRIERPIRTAADVVRLKLPDPEQELRFVMDAIRLVRRELAGRVPLIGFAGSPWTVATYMVEGGASKTFGRIKGLLYAEPATLHRLLRLLTRATIDYLNAQIAAGADCVMVFDTWGGVLSPAAFAEFSARYLQEIVTGVRAGGAAHDVPIILFSKAGPHVLPILAGTGADGLGLDATTELKVARALVGSRVALQGNLDPSVLYAPPAVIRTEVERVLESFGTGHGHVFNLGHGIHPDVPPEHAAAMIAAVHELSPAYHA
jgi:uroporphyrinogen decarboxylase